MITQDLNQILPQEHIDRYFLLEGSRLYRKLDSGAAVQVKSTDGNQIVTIMKGHRLRGTDIAWCLCYGNWPLFPVVQLRDDPLDFSRDNLYPARLRRLRYVQKAVGKLWRHPLSSVSHPTPEACRADWEMHAHDFYMRDMRYVLQLEEQARQLRTSTIQVHGEVPKPAWDMEKPKRTPRPAPVDGREWHWYLGAWVSVPVACHVADDYRMRIERQARGAVRFAFNPETRLAEAFDVHGDIVL